MNWYLAAFKNYAVFSGRARRKEFWMFMLFNILFSAAASILDMVLDTTFGNMGYGIFQSVYALALFIPGLAVTVRRLHDVGKSGWFYFIVLIPLIGIIWLLVLLCKEGDRGTNQYGEDPKEFESLQTDFA